MMRGERLGEGGREEEGEERVDLKRPGEARMGEREKGKGELPNEGEKELRTRRNVVGRFGGGVRKLGDPLELLHAVLASVAGRGDDDGRSR